MLRGGPELLLKCLSGIVFLVLCTVVMQCKFELVNVSFLLIMIAFASCLHMYNNIIMLCTYILHESIPIHCNHYCLHAWLCTVWSGAMVFPKGRAVVPLKKHAVERLGNLFGRAKVIIAKHSFKQRSKSVFKVWEFQKGIQVKLLWNSFCVCAQDPCITLMHYYCTPQYLHKHNRH